MNVSSSSLPIVDVGANMREKVFQIGFNRCGTRFMHQFLDHLQYRTVHWDGGRLAHTMMENFKNNERLLKGYDERFDAFSDMEDYQSNLYAHMIFYRILDEQYPGSRFILNTRALDVWIAKRLENTDYVHHSMAYHHFNTVGQMVEKWRRDWTRHHENVIAYFGESRIGKDLLIYDVDQDNPQKLFVFLADRMVVQRTFEHFFHTSIQSRFELCILPVPDGDRASTSEWFAQHVATYCTALPQRRHHMENLFESFGWRGDVWLMNSITAEDVTDEIVRTLSSVYMVGMPRSPCPYCTMETMWHPGIFGNPTKFCVHLSYLSCLFHSLLRWRTSSSNTVYTLVLEDDITFRKGSTMDDVMETCRQFAERGGDVLYLGFGHCKRGQTLVRERPSDRFVRTPPNQQILCKHAILYKNTYIERMFPDLLPLVDCSDVHFNHVNVRHASQVCIARPPLVFQDRHEFGSHNGNAEEYHVPLYDVDLSYEEEEHVHA